MRVGYTDVCCSEAGSVPLVLARFDWLSKKTHCVVTTSFISATKCKKISRYPDKNFPGNEKFKNPKFPVRIFREETLLRIC